MPTLTTGIDHIVIATPRLDDTVAAITSATGVQPSPGGRHDIGTSNYLVALTSQNQRTGAYLEIIGVTDRSDLPITPDNFGINAIDQARVATFCIPLAFNGASNAERARLLNAAAKTNRTLIKQSRTTYEGSLLQWTLLPPQPGLTIDPVPFGIDWGRTPHPSTTIAAELELSAFAASSEDPVALANLYGKLGLTIDVHPSSHPDFTLTLAGPQGEWTL